MADLPQRPILSAKETRTNSGKMRCQGLQQTVTRSQAHTEISFLSIVNWRLFSIRRHEGLYS